MSEFDLRLASVLKKLVEQQATTRMDGGRRAVGPTTTVPVREPVVSVPPAINVNVLRPRVPAPVAPSGADYRRRGTGVLLAEQTRFDRSFGGPPGR